MIRFAVFLEVNLSRWLTALALVLIVFAALMVFAAVGGYSLYAVLSPVPRQVVGTPL